MANCALTVSRQLVARLAFGQEPATYSPVSPSPNRTSPERADLRHLRRGLAAGPDVETADPAALPVVAGPPAAPDLRSCCPVDDLNLTTGVLHIRRAVGRVGGEVIVGTPKSDAGTRDVADPPHLIPMTPEHLAYHAPYGRRWVAVLRGRWRPLRPVDVVQVVLPITASSRPTRPALA